MAIEWKHKTVDLSVNSTEVEAVPCLVSGAYINTTLSAHACPIKDGTTGNQFTIPASAATGDSFNFGPTRYTENLTVDPDDAATGSVVIIYVVLSEPHG
jgi:hypothetical protein